MAQIQIPDAVFREIERILPNTVSADEFVVQAVREKLTFEDHKKEFERLSDRTRAAMANKGLTESDILAEFESARKALGG
jgi:hypothetical protein